MNYALTSTMADRGLMGIGCRQEFEKDLALTCQQAAASREPVAILLVEIDFFGQFQFACGVAACDECLDAVAECLLETTQRYDATVYAHDVGRFAVLLPNTDEDTAERIATEIHFQIGGLVIDHPRSPVSRSVSVSIGLAQEQPTTAKSPRELVSAAAVALTAARAEGRDRVVGRRPRVAYA